jgi:hypothetical protein
MKNAISLSRETHTERIFSDLLKKVRRRLIRWFFGSRSRNTTGTCLNYDTILLRVYLEIARTGDYSLLIVKGKVSHLQCLNAWEEIVRRNNECSGSGMEYNLYQDALEKYNYLLSEYLIAKAYLLTMIAEVDDSRIEWLKERGYHIDTSCKSKYIESINTAMRRVENLTTKMQMKVNEIKAMTERKGDKPMLFEDVIAHANTLLGFTACNRDTTLAEYNSYQKLIKKKVELAKKNNGSRIKQAGHS